jgi:hypothetical protein
MSVIWTTLLILFVYVRHQELVQCDDANWRPFIDGAV